MPAQRIKGQEITVAIIQDGSLQTQINTIQSSEFDWEIELLEEGYLGETSNRVDSVLNLIRFQLVGHCNNQDYLLLADAIASRARRRVGGVVRIDITGTFQFPDGSTPVVVIPDAYFENIPFTVGNRNEFLEFTLSGKASDYKILT